jgi:hypothetical protein
MTSVGSFKSRSMRAGVGTEWMRFFTMNDFELSIFYFVSFEGCGIIILIMLQIHRYLHFLRTFGTIK